MSLLCLDPCTVGKVFKGQIVIANSIWKMIQRRSPWHKLQPWWKKPLNVPKKRFPVLTCLSLTFKLTPEPVDKQFEVTEKRVSCMFDHISYGWLTGKFILISRLFTFWFQTYYKQTFSKIRTIQSKQYFSNKYFKIILHLTAFLCLLLINV